MMWSWDSVLFTVWMCTDCPSVLYQPDWLALRQWVVVLHRNSDHSVVWTDMECAEKRFWDDATRGRPPSPQCGAPVLVHPAREPSGHPVSSKSFWHFTHSILKSFQSRFWSKSFKELLYFMSHSFILDPESQSSENHGNPEEGQKQLLLLFRGYLPQS